ncbi:MAG: HIT family protein [Erysipelotrichaceae bacterium]|nr:HIT family protein [Erysipelotrichaceae bacterium]MDY5252830.1 HIT family protein [Erysipelotrichaceae bacterium]
MCIFCSIINNEIPSYKLYEDENVLAFLDISQTTFGHTIVVPKKHFTNILDVDPDTYCQLMKVVKELACKIQTKTNAKGINILHNANEAAGQTVMHMHYHIIPRYDENDKLEIVFNENPAKDLEKAYELLK